MKIFVTLSACKWHKIVLMTLSLYTELNTVSGDSLRATNKAELLPCLNTGSIEVSSTMKKNKKNKIKLYPINNI